MADETATGTKATAKPLRVIDRIGVPEIIDLTLIFGLLIIIFLWIVFKPDPNNQLLTAIITGWMTMTGVVVSFHRGSSSGSKNKDDAATRMMDKMNPSPNGTGPGAPPAAIVAAAEAAAPAAAAQAAPPAAAEAAPPAAEVAVEAALVEHGITKPKE